MPLWFNISASLLLAALGFALTLVALRRRRAGASWLPSAIVGAAITLAAAILAVVRTVPLGQFWASVPYVLFEAPFVAGLLVLVAGLAIGAWALFEDRARGRRRCPRCWYDMAAVPGLACPECGRNARRERGLYRTRRRWRLAIASLAASSVGGATIVATTVPASTLWTFAPDFVIIAAIPRTSGRSALLHEFRRRQFLLESAPFRTFSGPPGHSVRDFSLKPLFRFERWLLARSALLALEKTPSHPLRHDLLVLGVLAGADHERLARIYFGIIRSSLDGWELDRATIFLPQVEPDTKAIAAAITNRINSIVAADPSLAGFTERDHVAILLRGLGPLGADAAVAVPTLITLLPLAEPTGFGTGWGEPYLPVAHTLGDIGPSASVALPLLAFKPDLSDCAEGDYIEKIVADLRISGACATEEAALVKLMDHSVWRVRRAAATHLRYVDPFTDKGREALVRALRDADPYVVETAAESLLERNLERDRVYSVLTTPSSHVWTHVHIMWRYGLDPTPLIPHLEKEAEATSSSPYRNNLHDMIRRIRANEPFEPAPRR